MPSFSDIADGIARDQPVSHDGPKDFHTRQLQIGRQHVAW
jgi:hypothetical protein